jgi:hypothetical protein
MALVIPVIRVFTGLGSIFLLLINYFETKNYINEVATTANVLFSTEAAIFCLVKSVVIIGVAIGIYILTKAFERREKM